MRTSPTTSTLTWRDVARQAIARQAKVARIVAAFDHDRRGPDGDARPWAGVLAGIVPDDLNLEQLIAVIDGEAAVPEVTAAAVRYVAARAKVNRPSHDTIRLVLAHIDALSVCEANPVPGVPDGR